jgi:hypothetical protein
MDRKKNREIESQIFSHIREPESTFGTRQYQKGLKKSEDKNRDKRNIYIYNSNGNKRKNWGK